MGLFVHLTFKIKRFRNGFPFLEKRYISLLGVTIALVVFQCYTIVNIINEKLGTIDSHILFLAFCIVISIVLIIIWWRTGLLKAYQDSLIAKEIEELYRELTEKENKIIEVERDNAALSKIIHRDNKLIPTLENAVKKLYMKHQDEEATILMAELNRVCAERHGILKQYRSNSKQLPTTKIYSLDITLDYMKQKACENNIEFDVFVNGNLKHMITNYINEEQLRTIVADLLENAIIAVKSREFRLILIAIGIFNDAYEIRVEDSGICFEKETLHELGKKQTTTHEDEGGMGIGMMEVFKIMKETKASLFILQLSESRRGFTKSICVRFDGKGEFNVE